MRTVAESLLEILESLPEQDDTCKPRGEVGVLEEPVHILEVSCSCIHPPSMPVDAVMAS